MSTQADAIIMKSKLLLNISAQRLFPNVKSLIDQDRVGKGVLKFLKIWTAILRIFMEFLAQLTRLG